MATINLGSIKFNWKGAYNGATAYAVDDVVSSGGSSYVCILASTGNATSNGTYWEQMSSAGTNGTDGTDLSTTLTTQGDVLYRDGSGLQRLPKGTANQVLKINSGATAPEWGTDAGGSIRKVSMFNDSTYNITTSNSSVSFPITFDFVKSQADSDLFITGWTPVSGQNSYMVGVRMRLQKTSDSSYDSPSDYEGYGGNLFQSPPVGSGDDDVKGQISWSRRIDTSSETFFNVASTFRIHLGWSSRNGSAERPGNSWNPQNLSGRARQNSTQIWVWEIDPTKTSFIT
mgnify:FL=1